MAANTLADRLLALLKDNPVVAVLVLVGTAVIALSRFTDALKSLRELASRRAPPAPADLSGEWVSPVVENRFDRRNTYRLTLELRAQGKNLLGTLRQTSANPERPYEVEWGLLGGTVEGNAVAFHTQHAYQTSRPSATIGEPPQWVEVPYQVHCRGTVAGDELRLVLQVDRGYPPEEVVARRSAGAPVGAAAPDAGSEPGGKGS